MKRLMLIIAILVNSPVCGQEGYIKLLNDSTLHGYLRKYVSFQDSHQGFELWRTKNDKSPRKIPKVDISEYAIKKDTFKVLQQYRPFDNQKTYFEIVDALLISRGKVDLYVISQVSTRGGGYVSGGISAPTITTATEIYVLEDKDSNVLKALPLRKENLKEALKDFFPEGYILLNSLIQSRLSHDQQVVSRPNAKKKPHRLGQGFLIKLHCELNFRHSLY
jgi:hypothetical protein